MGLLNSLKNFAKVTLSTGYTFTATTVVLSSGNGALLPTGTPFNLVWWDSTLATDPADDPNVEVVRCTNIATDTLTITRAQEGTSATNKNTAGHIYKMIAGLTAKGPESLQIGSGANANASYLLDTRSGSGVAQIHITDHDADDGAYIQGVHSSSYKIGSGVDPSTNTAKETTASILLINSATGTFNYFYDTGLTPGNIYTPTLRCRIDGSGNIGALGVTPNVGVDAGAGALATRPVGVTLANGANQNVNIGSAGLISITGPSAGFSIGGFTGGVPGRILTILNNTTQVLTINNQDAGSSAGNKIATTTGGNFTNSSTAGNIYVFFYDGLVNNQWILWKQ